jgi:uncharacterized protein YbjT (DUF2867 family)
MILLTGGTGTAGSEISKALERMGVHHRSLVRDRVKAAASAGEYVELVEGGPVASRDAGGGAGRRREGAAIDRRLAGSAPTGENFIRAAKRAGVRYVVKFSAYGASLKAPHFFGRQHGQGERRLEDSGLAFHHAAAQRVLPEFPGQRRQHTGAERASTLRPAT